MSLELNITDPTFVKPASFGPLDRFYLRFIRDERDLPFMHLTTNASVVLMSLTVAMYVPGVFRWWMAPIYWGILLGFFLDRFILMLHNTSHRPLFKKEYAVLNRYIPWILGPFMGETPDTYFAHHLGMHHAENNLRNDLSTTLPYQRDRFSHWLHYFLRFFFFGIFELSAYFYRRKRWDMFRRTVLGELTYYAVVIALLVWNPGATFVVFLFPFMFTRFAMMAGNWVQHAFVDAADPGNCYKNSLTCINSRYNRRCFNDGYHIGHHIRANRHWTEMPDDFLRNIDKYRDEGAVIFQGVDYFEIWILLMTGQYRKLASHYVNLDPSRPMTEDEVIAHLKTRLSPVDDSHVAPASPQPATA
jgi:hypothetical protein